MLNLSFRALGLAVALLLTGVLPLHAQHTFSALVRDAHSSEPLFGVNVVLEGTTVGGTTDAEGRIVLADLPAGRQTLVFSFVGFETLRRTFTFPLADAATPLIIDLEEAEGELGEVTVTAMRTSRTIADQPTRVETIAGEEIEEKVSMEPSNITMLLNESPGITVQPTSATSGNAGLRIQGLDGRYTQLLKDGFPLYGGFAGGLSLLQVPPLDLAQVEVIKGPASTLYGGDAIAGLVNLVSKHPTATPERSLLVNATTAAGFDVGGFYAARGDRFGVSVLATGNLQRAYDPDDDAFSNLPETRRVTFQPRVYLYANDRTSGWLGLSAMAEEREGGDLAVLNGNAAGFFERNRSYRLTSQARLDHAFAEGRRLTIKNSVTFFDRTIEVPGYRFAGQQLASYTEASALFEGARHDLVLGVDLRTDGFREDAAAGPERDYHYLSVGAFGQDTWDLTERLAVEAGLRGEYHGTFGFFALPKVSILYRWADGLSTRVGGGLGYKAPTVFLEPSEARAFRAVAPLADDIDAETSVGGSVDVNYRGLWFDRLAVSVNQAFYFTNLRDALVPATDTSDEGPLRYRNAPGPIRTRALETNAKLSLDDLKLFLGYVYLDAETEENGPAEPLRLTPTHKTYTVLMYEQHGKGRIGLEGYYTSPQTLANGARSEGYWILGIMAERRFGPATFFLNFENLLDTKQTNYAPVVLGERQNPRFAELWAPMDGFVVNGGVKYRF